MRLRTRFPEILLKRTGHRIQRHTHTRRERRASLRLPHPGATPRHRIVQAAGRGKEDPKDPRQKPDKERDEERLGYPTRFLSRILHDEAELSHPIADTISRLIVTLTSQLISQLQDKVHQLRNPILRNTLSLQDP